MKKWALRHRCGRATRVDSRVAARFALGPKNPATIEYCGACDAWDPRPAFRLEAIKKEKT